MLKRVGIRYNRLVVGLFFSGLVFTALVLFGITFLGSINGAKQELQRTAEKEQALARLVYEQYLQQMENRLRRAAADKDLIRALRKENRDEALYTLDRINDGDARSMIDILILDRVGAPGWIEASIAAAEVETALPAAVRVAIPPDVWGIYAEEAVVDDTATVVNVIAVPIIDFDTGLLLGRLVGGTSLTDSFLVPGTIANVLNIETVALFHDGKQIAGIGEFKDFAELERRLPSVVATGHELTSGVLMVAGQLSRDVNNHPIYFATKEPSATMKNIWQVYLDLFGPFLLYAIVASLVAAFLLRRFTSPALNQLMNYAQELRGGKLTAYAPGRIAEFNELAGMFQNAFEAVRTTDAQFRELIDGSMQGVIVHADQRILYVNDAFLEILGYEAGEQDRLLGKPILSVYHKDERDRLQSFFNMSCSGSLAPRVYTVKGLRADGGAIWLEQHVRMTSWHGDDAFYATITDITERKHQEELVVQHANFDRLTGLPNRNLFLDRLRQEVARSGIESSMCALLYIDLDRFKTINEILGHDLGDALIKTTANRISDVTGPGHTVARLSGDEFAVILTGLEDEWSVETKTADLVAAISKPMTLDGEREALVTASIGISIFPGDGHSQETLLRQVDTAMYQAKSDGGNTYRFFSKRLNKKANRAIKIEVALRKAIAAEVLDLHYQPIIDFRAGSVARGEALVRWTDPDLGVISPAEFIPIAEESGLIVPLGTWILRRACQFYAQCLLEGYHLPGISVNISPRQCREDGFVELVASILEETGVPPESLHLEITESVMFDDRRINPTVVLSSLRALGLKLSLDDFGTGFSSLSYLKRLPINTLKIDRSFITEIEEDASDQAMVSAIISMAHNLGIEVVCEGAETKAQCEILGRLGCGLIQGFYFSRPLPEAELKAFLAKKTFSMPAAIRAV